jgi:cytochrome c peroxidase
MYRSVPGFFLLALLLLVPGCGGPGSEQPPVAAQIPPPIPLGLGAELPVPADNPLTAEKVHLGKLLYFDPRLSRDHTVSCATCHNPELGFGDGLPTSVGVDNQRGARNAPTVLNTAYHPHQFWDGRAATLEEQALGPIENPIEMANTLEAAVETIGKIEAYRRLFQEVFGTGVTAEGIAMSIAAFERTLLSGNSPWDRFNEGDETALGESARRGWELFKGRANCTSCHVGSLLTDFDFHNLGVGMNRADPDLGRYGVTQVEADKGAFKTPTLRDITKTAPYMHDGSVATLKEVIELYDRGGEPNPWLDDSMEPLSLSNQEKADLLAFMRSLEGDPPVTVGAPDLPDLVDPAGGG